MKYFYQSVFTHLQIKMSSKMVDKVAIVTGSNKGIGFAIVKSLCEKFSGIVYLTARDEGRGKAAVAELEKLGLHPKFHQLDVTDDNSVNKFRDFIKENHGGIDILVNNAAIAFKRDATEPLFVQAKETIDVNYFGLLRVCKALFPLLRTNARVVNVSSSVGHSCRIPGEELRNKFKDPNLTVEQLSELMLEFVDSTKRNQNTEEGWGSYAYFVSKVGVSALTFIQQKEFDKDTSRPGIAVNAVHPGYVVTDMTGQTGDWTTEQGADAPVYLALLPTEGNQIKGCYVWKNREVFDWTAEEAPLY